MKYLNLFALGQATPDDLSALLHWLECIPSGEASLDQIKRTPPIRTCKLSPTLKVLEQFGLISGQQERVVITASGEDFAKSPPPIKRALLRALLCASSRSDESSSSSPPRPTADFPKRWSMNLSGWPSPAVVIEAEIQAFIGWAESCELFGYDRIKDEIFRLEQGLPKGPVEKPGTSSHLTLVPKAS